MKNKFSVGDLVEIINPSLPAHKKNDVKKISSIRYSKHHKRNFYFIEREIYFSHELKKANKYQVLDNGNPADC